MDIWQNGAEENVNFLSFVRFRCCRALGPDFQSITTLKQRTYLVSGCLPKKNKTASKQEWDHFSFICLNLLNIGTSYFILPCRFYALHHCDTTTDNQLLKTYTFLEFGEINSFERSGLMQRKTQWGLSLFYKFDQNKCCKMQIHPIAFCLTKFWEMKTQKTDKQLNSEFIEWKLFTSLPPPFGASSPHAWWSCFSAQIKETLISVMIQFFFQIY